MQASFRPGAGRVARVRVRIAIPNGAASSEATVTDLMLQPGGAASGWLPHVSELPWAPGTVGS